jgi:hypothetical protein
MFRKFLILLNNMTAFYSMRMLFNIVVCIAKSTWDLEVFYFDAVFVFFSNVFCYYWLRKKVEKINFKVCYIETGGIEVAKMFFSFILSNILEPRIPFSCLAINVLLALTDFTFPPPLLLMMGYRLYKIKTKKGVSYKLLSKRRIYVGNRITTQEIFPNIKIENEGENE